MSIYFSRFVLNTYSGSPYFNSQIPTDYKTSIMLQRARAFRRLPPNLKKLAKLAKRWAIRKQEYLSPGIEQWYDSAGNELNPRTGAELTDAEIDAQWGNSPQGPITDIPLPPGGFADPDTWEEPKKVEQPTGDGLSTNQLFRDVYTRGRKRVAHDYGIPIDQLPFAGTSDDGTDWQTTRRHFKERASKVLRSPWFNGRNVDRAFLKRALDHADLWDDLGGRALELFHQAEGALFTIAAS